MSPKLRHPIPVPTNTVITVENLGKHYTLQHQVRSGLLRDQLAELLRNPFRRGKTANATAEEFWALQEVSFAVNQGDVLGIIGRNGAGKSTLLKILSRITEPTTGRVTLRGRVASLLEVGTGFHPELTGRENIFLNGAILGMTRAEIRRKFDEIVAFAEVEKFLDTPVKFYSSGMYVRLAFAVAAHLEPEILIVDEVLAVGDMQFQQKCLGKMQQVSRSEGRTVLFVSHNLEAVEHLCTRVVHLEHGRIINVGPSATMIAEYIRRSLDNTAAASVRPLCDGFRLERLHLNPNPVAACDPLQFELGLCATERASIHDLHLFFYNQFGHRVAILDLRADAGPYLFTSGQRVVFSGTIGRLALVAGNYSVGFSLRTARDHQDYFDLFQLTIGTPATHSTLTPYAAQYQGTTLLDYNFDAHMTPPS
jgi:lipopolysaccharide transport system ATP-binding protein